MAVAEEAEAISPPAMCTFPQLRSRSSSGLAEFARQTPPQAAELATHRRWIVSWLSAVAAVAENRPIASMADLAAGSTQALAHRVRLVCKATSGGLRARRAGTVVAVAVEQGPSVATDLALTVAQAEQVWPAASPEHQLPAQAEVAAASSAEQAEPLEAEAAEPEPLTIRRARLERPTPAAEVVVVAGMESAERPQEQAAQAAVVS